VASGDLAPGEPLPTVRGLAAALGVSPTTVAAAYRALRTRGVVATAGRRGTAVTRQPPLRVRPGHAPPAGARDLWSGNPARALLPPLRRAIAQVAPEHLLYGQPAKLQALAELAAADFAADGIAGELAIAGGALDGIERVLQAHLRPGDRVAVEDPSWPRIADLLHALGLVPVPVPVDERGMQPRRFGHVLADVRAVIVTPRGQNPIGAALDTGRTADLRDLLQGRPDVLLVEDDYLGAVSGAPYHGLHGATERWVVIRSLSKLLGPDLRVAPLVGDPFTVSRVEGRQLLGTGWVSHILQSTAAALWRDAADRGLLARAERVYSERRQALLDALAAERLEATGRTGFGVWVPVAEEVSIVQRLLETGWAVSPGERFRFSSAPGIRITTTELEPADAVTLAAAIAAAVRSPGTTYAA
jgi:DNA-binding transcriptional MocR family regulator